MLNISYNLSSILKNNLTRIENLRHQILLTPISPKIELKLRWEGMFDRIYYSLKLCGNSLDRKNTGKLLYQSTPKKLGKQEQEILRYKNGFDYILQNWMATEKPIDSQTLIKLYKIIASGKLSAPVEELQYLLDYLQNQRENPIILSAIIYIQIMKLRPFTQSDQDIALLLATLFLYKFGFDFRGFLSFEKEWVENNDEYKENFNQALHAQNLTLWLEYFSDCILKQAEPIANSLSRPGSLAEIPKSFWELNDRHKSILDYLSIPQATITNRKLQKKHNISQITASRDLSKLTNLGLLFSHGKGRSVYYTRI